MNNKSSEQDAFLPLPDDSGKKPGEESLNPAVELIRKRVEAAYAVEPDAAAEVSGTSKEAVSGVKLSNHQKFIYELTTSDKSMAEIQMAWHEYYAGLPDEQKHEVWQEFYAAQAMAASQVTVPAQTIPTTTYPTPLKTIWRTLADVRAFALSRFPRRAPLKPKGPARSILFGLGVGAITILIVLFGFFNERFIAPFIQPSRSLSNVPLITDNTAIGPSPEIIIPKINVQIPVVYGVTTIDESSVQTTLEGGVVHYADTALPGQNGNAVIVGHSSNNIFNKGKYKFAFVLLSRLEPGDTFYLHKDGKRYTYQVYLKKIVKPDDVSVLGPADKPATATLITCDPPGTSISRLVVTAEQISPDPSANTAQATDNSLATQTKVIPSNAPTLWSRVWNTISR